MHPIRRIPLTAFVLCAVISAGCRNNAPDPSPSAAPTATTAQLALDLALPTSTPTLVTEPTDPPSPVPPTEPPPTATPAPAFESAYEGISLDMLASLNQWRVDQGLSPFKRNETLDEMALAQARYISSLGNLPDNFHEDRSGSGFFERAADLGWPHYSNPQQIAVGEVAYVGPNIGAAVDYWNNSKIHNATITNAGYREIGIGIVPHVYGHVFMVVVGSRPNVMVALVDPASGQLYVTSERYKWSAGGDWIHEATQLQLLDAATSTPDASAWTPFAPTVAARFDATFYVALADATHTVIVEVNPYRDVAWLPSNLASIGQPLPAAPTPVAGAALAVIYDAVSLSVQNISGGAVDFTQIVVGEGGSALPLTHWLAYFKADPLVLSYFPTGECLQAHAMGIAYPGAPSACSVVRGVVQVQTANVFWKDSFNVYWKGQIAATCAGGEGICEVRLPQP